MRLEPSLCLAPCFVELGYAGVCFEAAEVGCAVAGCVGVCLEAVGVDYTVA